MKILVFVLGALFGAYFSGVVMTLVYTTFAFGLACCNIVVGAL